MSARNDQVMLWRLNHGADPNLRCGRGFTALEYAATSGSLQVVKYLVEHGADINGCYPLQAATRHPIKWHGGGKVSGCSLRKMEYLLEQGANIELTEPLINEDGSYRISISFTGTPLLAAAYSEDPEVVRFLLQNGANRHIKSVEGLTPLETAEGHNYRIIAEILRSEKCRGDGN